MDKFILSIDQGTTGTTALLTNANTLQTLDKVNIEFTQIFPQPAWVEHNLHDIWTSVEKSIIAVLKKTNINAQDIVSIGITNQRETTCAFDKTGRPLHNAIVWQDRRTASFCQDKKEVYQQFKMVTGLPLDKNK